MGYRGDTVPQAVQKLYQFLQELLYERQNMIGDTILSHQLWLESSTETVLKTPSVAIHARKMHLDTVPPKPHNCPQNRAQTVPIRSKQTFSTFQTFPLRSIVV